MTLHLEQWENPNEDNSCLSQENIYEVINLLRDAIDKEDFNLVQQSLFILEEETDSYFNSGYNLDFE